MDMKTRPVRMNDLGSLLVRMHRKGDQMSSPTTMDRLALFRFAQFEDGALTLDGVYRAGRQLELSDEAHNDLLIRCVCRLIDAGYITRQ